MPLMTATIILATCLGIAFFGSKKRFREEELFYDITNRKYQRDIN